MLKDVTFKIPREHYLYKFIPMGNHRLVSKRYMVSHLELIRFHVTQGVNVNWVQTLILCALDGHSKQQPSPFYSSNFLQSNSYHLLDSVPKIPQYFNAHNFYNPDLWLKTYWEWQGRTP